MPRITPNLWFDTQSQEAAQFYTSIFPNSRINNVACYPAGEAVDNVNPGVARDVLTVDFELDGQPFTAINGGPIFQFSEAVSMLINCKDQAEVNYYWEKLLDGGQESQCGWLKDKYGFSWQVVPDGMNEVLGDPDPAKAQRAMAAMMQMIKLDLPELKAAADGQITGFADQDVERYRLSDLTVHHPFRARTRFAVPPGWRIPRSTRKPGLAPTPLPRDLASPQTTFAGRIRHPSLA